MFNFLQNCQTVFQRTCTIFHPQQKQMSTSDVEVLWMGGIFRNVKDTMISSLTSWTKKLMVIKHIWAKTAQLNAKTEKKRKPMTHSYAKFCFLK